MTEEMTLDNLSKMAAQAGLRLPDDELEKLLRGVNRTRKQADELRQFLSDATEPAAIFTALRVNKV